MGYDVLEFIYLVSFFLGLGFAVLSGLLAGVFSGHAGAHIDPGPVHHDGLQAGGPDGHVHFSPLSPVTAALFITSFGGVGLLLKKMGQPVIVQIPGAAIAGLAVGFSVAWIFYRIMLLTQGSSQPREGEAIGIEAEVTVPIPNDGLGEIAYVLRETRYTNSAKTSDGKELPARTVVRIVKQVGTTYVVQKAS